jgi:glycosyltransferase involved in cell wall biosynthesis
MINVFGALRRILQRRRAGPSFPPPPDDWDEDLYLTFHPDVRNAVNRGIIGSGFEHYERCGRQEKRRIGFPMWLKGEMRALSDIEPLLFPSVSLLMGSAEYRAEPQPAETAYISIMRSLGDQKFTHVFLLPWLKRGGADIVAKNYINVLTDVFGAKVAVILTEDADHPWIDGVSASATILEFGKAVAALSEEMRLQVLMRLLLSVQAPVCHNINSRLGWNAFCRHSAALSQTSKLYVSLFAFSYSPDGEMVGYPRELDKIAGVLQGVFTDNQPIVDKLVDLYAVPRDLFSVHHSPVNEAPRIVFSPQKPQRILWAGRLDRDKRPDLLLAIAQALPDCTFDVFGESILDCNDAEILDTISKLRALENVVLHGVYDGFKSIPTGNYSLFLYTSQSDGMPNVVLEALSSGLAVIAPDVGGIKDVIPPDSGFLVEQHDDVDGYVAVIRSSIQHPERIEAERNERMRQLRDRHSLKRFVDEIAHLPPYATPTGVSD